MSWREAAALIIRARREGVVLSVKADGKLGWRANPRPPDELLAVLKEHKATILALIDPPHRPSFAIGPAKATAARLRRLGFRAYLEGHVLLIADETGRRRDLSRRMPIAEVFETIVKGLADNPDLLDLDTAMAEPDLPESKPSEPERFEPERFEPEPSGLAEESELLDEEERTP